MSKTVEGKVININHYPYTSKTTGEQSMRTNLQVLSGSTTYNANISKKQFDNFLTRSEGITEANLRGNTAYVNFWSKGETTNDIVVDGEVVAEGVLVNEDFTLVKDCNFAFGMESRIADKLAAMMAAQYGIAAPSAPTTVGTPVSAE